MKHKCSAVLFDLDGTLTDSRQQVEPAVAQMLAALLNHYKVGIVSGCSLNRMEEQLLNHLPVYNKGNLYLFPSTASCGYRYDDNGRLICLYELALATEEKKRIIATLLGACRGYIDHRFGEVIDDRGGQIALALLGLSAPLPLKKIFDPDNRKRELLKRELDRLLPEYEVIIGGTTTIGVTRKGVDKAFCLTVFDECGMTRDEVLYLGDAVYAGGNDYPLVLAGVSCVSVSAPSDTAKIMEELLEDARIQSS